MEDCNCNQMAAMDDSTTAAISKRRKITTSTPPLPLLLPSPTILQLLHAPASALITLRLPPHAAPPMISITSSPSVVHRP
ncbi:hypothetical protein ACFX1Q_027762 [Malus domestica]